MKVDKETLKKTAHLARLEFDEKDEESMLKDLNQILDWVAELDELDTSEVEPLTHMSAEINIFREDQAANTLNREDALKLAPQKDEQYFKVPKVLE